MLERESGLIHDRAAAPVRHKVARLQNHAFARARNRDRVDHAVQVLMLLPAGCFKRQVVFEFNKRHGLGWTTHVCAFGVERHDAETGGHDGPKYAFSKCPCALGRIAGDFHMVFVFTKICTGKTLRTISGTLVTTDSRSSGCSASCEQCVTTLWENRVTGTAPCD